MASLILVGATGNIGSRVLAEALRRGHAVTAATRDPAKLSGIEGCNVATADSKDTGRMAEALRGHDVAIFAVKWNENDVHQVIEAARASGVPRFVFVVGAGSLAREDGRLHFDHMKDKGAVPPTSAPAMQALDALRIVQDIEWTAVSPPAEIYAGDRTGRYRLGGDAMPAPSEGHPHARISREDFAVAILDEIERPAHSRRRFTAAN